MDLFDKHAAVLQRHGEVTALGRDPFGVCMDEILSPTEALIQGKRVLLLGTNNYLGLTFDPACIQAAQGAIASDGTGTTGSRIANGTYARHVQLEKEIAEYLDCSEAMVFPTGFQANLGLLAGMTGPKDIILLDADCHASIYDGCALSGATVIRFRHNDPADLEKRLARIGEDCSGVLIVVEGIYSMFGDQAPLKEICAIKRKYNAYLMVDEAHSLGVLGEGGRGLVEQEGCQEDTDFIVGTFSKSLGAVGGFIASSHPKFHILRYASRPYMFTASASPSNVASVRAALRKLRGQPELKDQVWQNARQLYAGLSELGYELCADESAIVAVRCPDEATAIYMWNKLLETGVYANLALPPGTPNSTCLIRCSLSAAHTKEQIDEVIRAFASVSSELDSFREERPTKVAKG